LGLTLSAAPSWLNGSVQYPVVAISFVGFADFRSVMTEEKLIEAAHHLAESREQFVKELRLAVEGFMAFSDRLRTFGEYLDARDAKINAGVEINASVHESLARLVDLLKENTIALNENTERLDSFLKKFETYFGTERGLDFEN
jgi:hypothetical protein